MYSSPYLQAAPGSMHGYDVVDHQRVNEELGGREAHERFSKRLGENGLGQVLDIVPNHMSLGHENRFWWDVLENGMASRYASFFDIDWQPQEERLRDKVLVPILADQYGRVLQDGGIKVTRNARTFHVEAGGQILPVTPNSLAGHSQSRRRVFEVGHAELSVGLVRPTSGSGRLRPPCRARAASR